MTLLAVVLTFPASAQFVGKAGGPLELKVVSPRSPDGYAPKELAENLWVVAQNIFRLENAIRPWKKPPPPAEEVPRYMKDLEAQEALAARLVKEADRLIKKGFPRTTKPPNSRAYPSADIASRRRPGPLDDRMSLALARANVAARVAAVLEFKLLDPVAPKLEALQEDALKKARKELKDLEKR